MKLSNKISVGVLAVSLALGLATPFTAFAITAIAPDLGTASSFSVFAGSAMTADGSGATISADLGVNPGLSVSGSWTHTGGQNYFGTGGRSGTAKTDATAAWTTMGSTGGTTWDPAVPADMTPVPGLYTRSGDATVSTTLTLNGSATDVWIFQINDSLTFTNAATVVLTGGASACNVFWRIASSATINGAPGKTFAGTLIANSDVSLVTGATVVGRMMALTGTLSAVGITSISGCATPAASGGNLQQGNINVVKTVINDSGGTKTVADFPLFVNSTPVVSGVTNVFPAPALVYTVTETYDSSRYTQSFSGACDSTGRLTLSPGDNKFCIVTNNDIGVPVAVVPPLIDVVKTASPLSLPGGSGPVTYTYTLRNTGTVPVTDITMVGDTCSPIVRVSGDTNGDNKLQVNETWVHTCATTLSATHTNTVVATGWANGISATDIASATVVVGAPIVPPIIHVVKIPSTFLLSAPGGEVTYTYIVTNPGTAPLSDVSISDNKCTGLPGRVVGHPGDLNKNNLLESNESWVLNCKTNLTQTTTNTGTVVGSANGLTATDFALATVVVASPKLPNTGLPPRAATPWSTVLFAGVLMFISASLIATLKKRSA
jgi:type VI secretion system secreted protein VgrG